MATQYLVPGDAAELTAEVRFASTGRLPVGTPCVVIADTGASVSVALCGYTMHYGIERTHLQASNNTMRHAQIRAQVRNYANAHRAWLDAVRRTGAGLTDRIPELIELQRVEMLIMLER